MILFGLFRCPFGYAGFNCNDSEYQHYSKCSSSAVVTVTCHKFGNCAYRFKVDFGDCRLCAGRDYHHSGHCVCCICLKVRSFYLLSQSCGFSHGCWLFAHLHIYNCQQNSETLLIGFTCVSFHMKISSLYVNSIKLQGVLARSRLENRSDLNEVLLG